MSDRVINAGNRVTGALGLAVFVIWCLYALTLEMRPFLLPQNYDPAYFQNFPRTGSFFGLSIYSWKFVVEDCYDGLARIAAEGPATGDKSAFVDACSSMARQMVTASPTYGPGWLVAAFAAWSRQDAAAFGQSLSMAYRAAPREQWQAERRIELAEANAAALPTSYRALEDADILLLARSEVGSPFLAQRYQTDLPLRERIIANVATLPMADQRLFLSNVRRLAQSRPEAGS